MFQILIRGDRVPNPMRVLAEDPLLWELFEAVHMAGHMTGARLELVARNG